MSAEALWYIVRALVFGAVLGVPVGYLLFYVFGFAP